MIETVNWEILVRAAYPPDLTPSDCHLLVLASLGHAFADQHFNSYENERKWIDNWLTFQKLFLGRGIHKLLESWEICITI